MVLLAFTLVYSQTTIWNLQLLTASLADGAACLDGSAPAYYIRPGFGNGVSKWLLFHEGGGWCTSLADCVGRSKTALGSSKSYGATMNQNGGYFSDDAGVNPLMYNWNMVYFKYCDGASFSGNNDTITTVGNDKLYWRGKINLQAYLDDLSKNHGLQKGTDYVISGCSAGGLATYLHVDWWKMVLPATSFIRGLPDSGYFLDYDSTNAPKYGTDMRWVFKQQNSSSGVNERCIAANTGHEENCIFAEHTVPFITTPIFPLQSRFDAWQTDNILGSKDPAQINTYGAVFDERFTAEQKNAANGYFLDSCFHHCGEWDNIRINGDLSGIAFAKWYTTEKGGHYFQEQTYPCATCCSPNF